MKPLILLTTGYYKADNDRMRRILWQSYADALERAGAMTALVTGDDPADAVRWAELADGLLLTGGVDIEPGRFGQDVDPCCGDIDSRRDELELPLFAAFASVGKPILGICRGMQLINVALGGSIYQDIPSQLGAQGHADGAVHAVEAVRDGWLDRLFGTRFEVNSYHHQSLDRLGEGLLVDARSPEGIIEAVVHSALPIWAVQWHPERMTGPERIAPLSCAETAPLFEGFVEQCRGK